jgi:hypothetical protein
MRSACRQCIHSPPPPFVRSLITPLRSFLIIWSFPLRSVLYHGGFWYPLVVCITPLNIFVLYALHVASEENKITSSQNFLMCERLLRVRTTLSMDCLAQGLLRISHEDSNFHTLTPRRKSTERLISENLSIICPHPSRQFITWAWNVA